MFLLFLLGFMVFFWVVEEVFYAFCWNSKPFKTYFLVFVGEKHFIGVFVGGKEVEGRKNIMGFHFFFGGWGKTG